MLAHKCGLHLHIHMLVQHAQSPYTLIHAWTRALTHTHACTHKRTHAHTHTRTHTHTHAHTRTHTHIHAHTHARTHTHAHTHAHTHTYIHTSAAGIGTRLMEVEVDSLEELVTPFDGDEDEGAESRLASEEGVRRLARLHRSGSSPASSLEGELSDDDEGDDGHERSKAEREEEVVSFGPTEEEEVRREGVVRDSVS